MSNTKKKDQTNKSDSKDYPSCGFKRYTTFGCESVVQLSSDAFSIHDEGLINLRYKDCFLILFYIENEESMQLARIWSMVAQQVPGPKFGACNVSLEKKVGEAFAKIASHPSHFFKAYSLHGWPNILVYRDTNPVAVYNGEREVGAIADYAATLACNANYFESVQVYGGVQVTNRYDMQSPTPYLDLEGQPKKKRHDSVQYTAGNTLRGFNPSVGLSLVGSEQNKKISKEVRQAQAEREGKELTPAELETDLGTEYSAETPKELDESIGMNKEESSGEESETPSSEGESEKESETPSSEGESETPSSEGE